MEQELEALLQKLEQTADTLKHNSPIPKMFHKKQDTDTRTFSVNEDELVAPLIFTAPTTQPETVVTRATSYETETTAESSPRTEAADQKPFSFSFTQTEKEPVSEGIFSTEIPKTEQSAPLHTETVSENKQPLVSESTEQTMSDSLNDKVDLNLKKGKDLEEGLKQRQAKLDDLLNKNKGQTF